MARQGSCKPGAVHGRGSLGVAIQCLTAVLLALFVSLSPIHAQTNTGELRLKVTDPSGSAVAKAPVTLRSVANQYENTLQTDDNGRLDVLRLPFGTYQIEVNQPGFAPLSQTIEIRSQLPTEANAELRVAPLNAQVTVTANNTLINPDQAGSVNQIGSSAIETRLSSLPGRSIQDLVNSQPGWLYEGNAVLHPRGSEYQTQFVVDGIPLTDNRSPSFGPELEADDVDSISIYTAGIPAEYGRKMGGVVELNTMQDTTPGFHGEAVLSGGVLIRPGRSLRGRRFGEKTPSGSAQAEPAQPTT